MDTQRLLSSTVLYGIADVIVLAVGGFLLLPVYTRTLTQEEFGIYVIFRANTEIFTYLLFFGLPSAVGRLYFIYRKTNQHIEYMSSIVTVFLLILFSFSIVLIFFGDFFWKLLSPEVPVKPYLSFSIALAAVGFYGAIGSIWLRMEGRVIAFVSMQVVASVVMALAAIFSLVFLGRGLVGLLCAMLLSGACPALMLPWLFGRRYQPAIKWAHITESLRYSVPIVIGYVAYFVLNRISTLILQRHVAVHQVAIYGLAQQLAMMVTIAGIAFGKAMQPAVFASEPDKAAELMERSGKILMLLMFCITSAIILFASDFFNLIAPKSYGDGVLILLILLVANFAYSFTLIADTALLYHRRPKTSVAVTVVGASLSASLGTWLIPDFQLYGAAFSTIGTFIVISILSNRMAQRVTGRSYLAPMLRALAAICLLALFTIWLQRQSISIITSIIIKIAICMLIFSATYFLYLKRSISEKSIID